MSKYTESPWLYSQNTVSGSNGSEMVAEVYGFDTLEKKANGKLIAAAPDLLEALIEAPIVSRFSKAEDFISAYEQWRDKYKTPALKAVQP